MPHRIVHDVTNPPPPHARLLCNSNHVNILSCFAIPVNFVEFPHDVEIFTLFTIFEIEFSILCFIGYVILAL